jgi:hypothetical protein
MRPASPAETPANWQTTVRTSKGGGNLGAPRNFAGDAFGTQKWAAWQTETTALKETPMVGTWAGWGDAVRAGVDIIAVQLLTNGMGIASAQQRPQKAVGVVLVIPPTGHLAHNGWFTTPTCDFFDLKEMNLYGAVFDAARSALSSRYKVVRVSVPPDAAIRTSNTEVFGAFKSFPPIGEQVRQFSRPQAPVDLYLVIWSSLSANTCALHPNTEVGIGIGLTHISSRPTHLHAFGEAFLVDARTLQRSDSVFLQSAFVRLDGFEWKGKRAELTDQQWRMIKAMMPKVLSMAVHSASKQLLDTTNGPQRAGRQN